MRVTPSGVVVLWAMAAAALAWLSPFEEFELRALDLEFNAMQSIAPMPARDGIVVIGIDSPSLESIAEPMGLWHGHFAKTLEALIAAPPAIVVFDVVMPDRSLEGTAPGYDRLLLRALITSRRAFPTVLAITIKEDERPRGIHPSFITAAGTAPGYALFPVDADGRVRRFDERIRKDSDEPLKTLIGEAARILGHPPSHGYIDFALGDRFGYVPFKDVLAAADRKDAAFLRERFAGKAVLVGTVLPFFDSVHVPVGLARWDVPDRDTPGVLLHAQALRSILADRLIERVPPAFVAAITLLAALLGLVARTPLRATAAAVPLAIAFPVAALVLLHQGRFLPFVWPLASALSAIALRLAIEIAARLGERRRLRNSFSGYVSPAVMRQILDGQIRPEGRGTKAFVCALFSDIRGYTTLSEGKTPDEILTLLNRYFERMVEIVHRHDGAVISFMGDGIMAIFGAPQVLKNPCDAAFKAGVDMLAGMRIFARELEAEGQPPISIGVGLHAGEAVIGHVGSQTRHDYTAIGDVVNVASRLESATKEVGYRLVCSREVVEQIVDPPPLVPLGPVSIKGHTAVEAYGFERVPTPIEHLEAATA